MNNLNFIRTLLALLLLADTTLASAGAGTGYDDSSKNALEGYTPGKKLSRKERMELAKEEAKKYMELRRQGVDEV
ncbi:expressed unknown protein (Partial), partial [Seminavis robusta]|eukprot:Sro3220_g345500.1 n/a (74) ;mRNA; f:7998-8219